MIDNEKTFFVIDLENKGKALVKYNGELVIVRGSSIKNCGYFTWDVDENKNCLSYSFLSKESKDVLIESRSSIARDDLFVFSVQLSRFLDGDGSSDWFNFKLVNDKTEVSRLTIKPMKK